MRKLWRLTTTFACAGLVTDEGLVTESAPIFKWTRGKALIQVEAYYRKKNSLMSLECVRKEPHV